MTVERGTRLGSGRWVVAAVLMAAFALAGCGGQSTVAGDTHTIFVHDRSLLPRGGEDAEIRGTLAIRDGCVLLAQEDVGVAYPVIWPSGTSIASEDPLALELPSGDELAVGQRVRGAGGYHDGASPSVEVDVPPECLPETGEVAVFNPDDDPIVDG